MALTQNKNTSWKLGAAGYGRMSCFSLGTNGAKAYDFSNVVLPITSGSADVTQAYVLEPQYYATMDETVAKDINLGRGTNSVSGSVSFEFTRGLIDNIFTISEVNTNNSLPFFARNRYLSIYIADGSNLVTMSKAVWSSFSLSAEANSLVTGNLSLDIFGSSIDISNPSNITVNPSNTDYYELEKYWQYGISGKGITGFNFDCSRSTSAVYLNNLLEGPSYYIVGKLEVEIKVDVLGHYELAEGDLAFALGKTKKMTLKNSYASSKSYSLGSTSNAGTTTYTLRGLHNTIGEVFTIEERTSDT